MERRIERFAIWSGPLLVLLFGVGWIVAGLLPPPPATDGPASIAAFYRAHTTGLRVGTTLDLFSIILWLFFVVALTVQLWRANHENPLLAVVHLVSGLAVVVALLVGGRRHRDGRLSARAQRCSSYLPVRLVRCVGSSIVCAAEASSAPTRG
jgi:hypothetical protein